MSKILNQHQVCELTSLSRETIRTLEIKGAFPRRIALTPGPKGRKGWNEDEVRAWLENRARGFIGNPA